jgi:hypothetical protein
MGVSLSGSDGKEKLVLILELEIFELFVSGALKVFFYLSPNLLQSVLGHSGIKLTGSASDM